MDPRRHAPTPLCSTATSPPPLSQQRAPLPRTMTDASLSSTSECPPASRTASAMLQAVSMAAYCSPSGLRRAGGQDFVERMCTVGWLDGWTGLDWTGLVKWDDCETK